MGLWGSPQNLGWEDKATSCARGDLNLILGKISSPNGS